MSILAASGCALLAFDDIAPLRALGGGVLASPAWAPLLLAGAIAAPGCGLAARRLLWVGLTAVAVYATALTAATVLIDPSPAYGESPAAKAVRVLGAVLIWLGVLLAGFVLVRVVPRAMIIGVSAALLIMVVGAVMYRTGFHLVDELPLIHSGPNAQQRVRSSRFEASSLGAGMVTTVALVVLLLPRRRARFWACLGGLCLTVLVAESRGTELIALGGLVALIVPQALLALKLRLPDRAVPLLAGAVAVFAVALSLGLAVVVQSDLWHAAGMSDGARGTSDATRAGWAHAAVQVLLSSPLGLGFGSYLHETPRLLREAISALHPAFDPAALRELQAGAAGTDDSGVSPKTAPTLAAFHLGWPGVIALGTLWWAVLRTAAPWSGRASAPLFISIACVICVAGGYYSSVTAWEQALLFGAALGAAARLQGRRSSCRP